jgi:uncharacterized protein (UPF0276 family)
MQATVNPPRAAAFPSVAACLACRVGYNPTVQLAVNYSAAAADLVRRGEIRVDYFKCPAWPGLVETAHALLPVNVHFPLLVGSGDGDALDGETGQPADWDKVESLLAGTGTPHVNVHLVAPPHAYPGVPPDYNDPAYVERVTERLIADVTAVVRRFGAERVIAENNPPNVGECLRPAYLPEVITGVVRETGCRLLLDLAHVRLAAAALSIDAQHYTQALPTERIREIHVSGVQRIEGQWLERMAQRGVPAATIEAMAGRMFDHLPMTDEDWSLFEWAMAQTETGRWSRPWIVTFEYGGVGPLWEAVTDASVLRDEVSRLYELAGGG